MIELGILQIPARFSGLSGVYSRHLFIVGRVPILGKLVVEIGDVGPQLGDLAQQHHFDEEINGIDEK